MKHNFNKVFLGISLLLPLHAFAMSDSNSDNSQNQSRITRKNKVYHNLIAENATVIGELFVDGNELISGNVQIDGNLSIGGTIISDNSIDFPVLATGVVISSAGALSTSSGATGKVLTGNGLGTVPTFQDPAASSITITGDTGGALTGNSFTFTGGTTGLKFNGANTTETLGGTLVVANGGTGATTLTAHGVLLGEGTSAITATAVGSTNTVLLGNTGADPSFGQVPNAALVNSSITLSNGSNISITGSPVSLGGTAAIGVVAAPVFSGLVTAGGGFDATNGDVNIVAGNLYLPNSTATPTGNIYKGGVLFMNNFGNQNTYLGQTAGNLTATSAQDNVGVGYNALNLITTGSTNSAYGASALMNLKTGSGNTAIGSSAGINYANNESNNIIIGEGNSGVAGESGVIRIGVSGQTIACYIAGIYNATASGVPVLVSSSGQLGITTSSRRYKENIASMPDTTEAFMQLNPVMFNYKKQSPADVQYGLIAEEVAELYPDLVVYNSDNQVETVKYHLLYALLIKMIQENRKITDQNSELIKKNSELIKKLCAVCNVQ